MAGSADNLVPPTSGEPDPTAAGPSGPVSAAVARLQGSTGHSGALACQRVGVSHCNQWTRASLGSRLPLVERASAMR